MQNSFNIEFIPESELTTELIAKKTLEKIENNYKCIIEEFIKLVNLSMDEISKPITLFNLFFIVEVWAKYYLIFKSYMNMDEIEGKGHGLKELFSLLNKENIECKELIEKLKYFKNKDGQSLNIDGYYDFKYNKKRGKDDIIFNYEYDSEDKVKIRGVIECIEQYLSNQ